MTSNGLRFDGIYEVRTAARYLQATIQRSKLRYKVPSSKIIRWIRSGLSAPDIRGTPGRELLITFEDVISMRIVAFLRSLGYSLQKVRRAESLLRRITGHPRPLATERLWVEAKGAVDIFADIGEQLLTTTRSGQLAFLELVRENLIDVHGLTFDDRRIASSWTPQLLILLDPKVQFGRPCIQGTRIPTADLVGMLAAGDTMEFLARSYGISDTQVAAASEWEKELAAA